MKCRTAMTTANLLIGLLVALAVLVCIVAVVRLDVTGKKGSGLAKEFTFEVDTYIDPNLILYEESAQPITTAFAASSAVAVGPNDCLYVAGDKAIKVFSENGSPLAAMELTDKPRSLAVSDDGKVYVGMPGRMEVYDGQGNQLASWDSLGRDAVLTSIAVSKANVFVADAGNRIVLHYETTGKLIKRIGGKAAPVERPDRDENRSVPGFVIPSPHFDLAVAKDGLLRVVNPGRRRIEAYTLDGDLEFWWGESSVAVEGFCGCCNPVSFALLPDGGFVTCEKGLVRVKVYDSEGRFVGVVAGPDQLIEAGQARICEFPEQCQAGAFDVAVDSKGRVFVLDTIKNLVRVFSKKKAG
jgi:hypothetical protein